MMSVFHKNLVVLLFTIGSNVKREKHNNRQREKYVMLSSATVRWRSYFKNEMQPERTIPAEIVSEICKS